MDGMKSFGHHLALILIWMVLSMVPSFGTLRTGLQFLWTLLPKIICWVVVAHLFATSNHRWFGIKLVIRLRIEG